MRCMVPNQRRANIDTGSNVLNNKSTLPQPDPNDGKQRGKQWQAPLRLPLLRCPRIAISPDEIVRHLELRVIRVVFGGGGSGFSAGVLTVIEHDHAGVAFADFFDGRAR